MPQQFHLTSLTVYQHSVKKTKDRPVHQHNVHPPPLSAGQDQIFLQPNFQKGRGTGKGGGGLTRPQLSEGVTFFKEGAIFI